MQASDGCFYGSTTSGGTYRCGTVFKIAPNGTETTVLAFNGTNGANPWAGLIQGADGKLYGTTYAGGLWDKGTAFALDSNVLFCLYRSGRFVPVARLMQAELSVLRIPT